MRTEEGGGELDRLLSVQPADDPQLTQLGLAVEAVAALGLRGGHAEAQHLIQRRAGLVAELVLGGGAGGAHGGEDAAAAREDFEIAHAVELQAQLVLPPAAENQVRVRVDQPGRDEFSLRVEDAVGFGRGTDSDGGDVSVLTQHPGVA